jgi:hypothetical protein
VIDHKMYARGIGTGLERHCSQLIRP